MITVVMPVYNGEKYLNETLQSILRQGEAISGILIINDGSTDETEKIIRSWETKEKKISHINKKNEGVAKRGIAACRKSTADMYGFSMQMI